MNRPFRTEAPPPEEQLRRVLLTSAELRGHRVSLERATRVRRSWPGWYAIVSLVVIGSGVAGFDAARAITDSIAMVAQKGREARNAGELVDEKDRTRRCRAELDAEVECRKNREPL